ncbi:MAG: biotin/lipoyl-containing protein [Myxococcales bacterium]|jgi:biotin carboxyl carrier protein
MNNRFKLTLEGVAYDIERRGELILVNGQELPVEVTANAINVSGNPHAVELRGNTAIVDGITYAIEAQGLSEPKAGRRKAASTAAADEAGAVTAIMPGLIIKVAKKEGDKVEEGEVVVVLEAMKMQNEIKAKRSGTVRQVNVKEGETVEMRQVLVVIE